MAYHPNAGSLPSACVIVDDQGNVTSYRKIHVRCFGGYDSRKAGHDPWPSHTGRAQNTSWKISRPPFDLDIREWELA